MTATWSTTLWLDDLQEVDHAPLGLARLLWQYRGDQPRLQAFLESLLNRVQEVEDVAIDVHTLRWPLTATGVQLDVLGRIVGQERGELSDDAYRVAILGRIFVNRSDGRIEDFIELLEILGVTEQIKIYEFWPATIEVNSTQVEFPEVYSDLVSDLKGGGIGLYFAYSEYVDANVFQTSASLSSDDVDINTGLAAVGGAVGGKLMGVTRA